MVTNGATLQRYSVNLQSYTQHSMQNHIPVVQLTFEEEVLRGALHRNPKKISEQIIKIFSGQYKQKIQTVNIVRYGEDL